MIPKQLLRTGINNPKDLNKRCYVNLYLEDKRIKIYNGKCINLDINPNVENDLAKRTLELQLLEYEIKKAFAEGRYPIDRTASKHQFRDNLIIEREALVLKDALDEVLNLKLASNLSKLYKRNLKRIHKLFVDFLTTEEKEGCLSNLSQNRVQEFLNQFQSSSTYYMDKRRDINVLLSGISNKYEVDLGKLKKTNRVKVKATLHKYYELPQLKRILSYLEKHNDNLYICCLLSYSCFLRPHQEIRILTKSHFKNGFTQIHLSGSENKSGRIRVVPLPDYVREKLVSHCKDIEEHHNIFSKSITAYNEHYFSTNWTREHKKMSKLGLIDKDQTIYSFRHTGAIAVYKKTKDVHILQQLLGHSDMIVTLNYLRGLGQMSLDNYKEILPDL
ncbi:integrase family protein [Pseudopedobacter saltans DSM 12145]|uniref:Integrase family protein n=1 Tax=Pseudopedobacter saltans (strain ATCC 51119 / DSM 12145 / JCM 21818 / CCUG 39354 / LMG 10337 / NBRC 100064 / NCIMB 13643) TaxID=762903 RepID=F0S799_PSESL|nr:tyrosine-type recombinase/integrase [Pseudopedobacter saltans]ADY51124.1 integrase family protein [Pseudopedobacter saltans DSM 12145]